VERAPPPFPARRAHAAGRPHARPAGHGEPAPQAAAAAARALRSRLRPGRHQEEARRDPEDRARGHRAPAGGRAGAPRERRDHARAAGPARADGRAAAAEPGRDAEGAGGAHSRAPELRVHGSRCPPHVLGAHAVAAAADAAAVHAGPPALHAEHDAPGHGADARDAARSQPHAARARGRQRARLPGVQGQVGPALPRRGEPGPAPRAARQPGRAAPVAHGQHVPRPAAPAPGHDAVALHEGRAPRGRDGPARHEPRRADADRRDGPALRLPWRSGGHAP